MILRRFQGHSILAVMVSLLLAGCGGGGSGSASVSSSGASAATSSVSSSSSSSSSVNILSTGTSVPALLVSSSIGLTQLTYQGVQKTIPQDTALYKAHASAYVMPAEPSYTLRSVIPLNNVTRDVSQRKWIGRALSSVIYLNQDHLVNLNSTTFQEQVISAALNLNSSNSFCGFWSHYEHDSQTQNQYVIYAVSNACDNISASIDFYLTATTDTASTAPRKIDRPLGGLADGWLVTRTPQLGVIDLYRCNYDCSVETKVATLAGTKVRPFNHASGWPLSQLHLFSVDDNSAYVFDELTNTVVSVATRLTLPSATTITAEDDQYFYLPHSEPDGTAELLVISKSNLSTVYTVNLKTLNNPLNFPFTPNAIDKFIVSDIKTAQDFTFVKAKLDSSSNIYGIAIKKSPDIVSINIGNVIVSREAITGQIILSTSSEANQSDLSFIDTGWYNNALIFNKTYTTLGGTSYSASYIYGTGMGMTDQLHNSRWVQTLVTADSNADYIANKIAVRFTWDKQGLIHYAQPISGTNPFSSADVVTLGSISNPGNSGSSVIFQSVAPGGGFLYAPNNSTTAYRLYSFDVNQTNSLGCFFGC